MASLTLTKAVRTLVAAGTSNAAGSTTRGTADLRTVHGGLLTMKVTNGGTGPTIGCSVRVLVAHATGATPTAASAGADWKTLWSFTALTGNGAVTEQSVEIGPGVMHLEVEFTGNTGQAVTVEALLSEVSSVLSV